MSGLQPRDMREWMKVTERNIREGQRGTVQTIAAVQKQVLDVAEEANKDRGRIPAPPIELTAQTYIMIDPADKRFHAGAIIDFPDVSISTAAEEMAISQYELWGKLAADPDTAYALMDHSEVSALATFGMDVGSLWTFKVRAIGLFSLAPGEFSAPITVQMLSDTTAPGQPSTPTATNNRGAMTVRWDGKIAGGATMPLDLDYVVLAGGTTATPTTEVYRFPPSPNGTLAVIPGVPYNTTQYYRLQAVDTSGNKSPWSAVASAMVTPLVDADIIQTQIDAAKTQIINSGKMMLESGQLLETKLLDNTNRIAAAETSLNDPVTGVVAQVASAQSRLDNAKDLMVETNKTLGQKLGENTTSITTLGTDMTAAKADIVTAKSDIATSKTNIATLTTAQNDPVSGLAATMSKASTALANAATANSAAGTAQSAANAAKATADAAIAQAVNVLAEPGFENGGAGWQVLGNCAVIASATAHGGASVLRATAPASATLIQPEPVAYVNVREGQTWRAGFWFRIVGTLPTAGDIRIALRALNDAGSASFPSMLTILPAAMTNNWQWVEGFYKVPAGMVQIKPRLRVDGATTAGTVIEFDDVDFRDVSLAKDALDAAAAAQTKADTAFTNAQTALTNAGLAQTSADGKGRSLYTATTPAGTGYTNGDVWFKKLTGGQTQVNIWDSATSTWVPEVDKATADAAASAAAALTAGTTADGKAVNAQTAADNAAASAALAKIATLPSDRDTNGAGKWLFMRVDLATAPAVGPPTLDYFAAVASSTQAQVADGTDLVKNVGTNYRGLLRTSINVATAGNLTFTATHDDGASIYLDGVQVYTRGTNGTGLSFSIPVTVGWHLLDLVWTEVSGNDGWYGFTPTIGSQVAALVAPALASTATDAAAAAQAKANQATTDAATAKTAGDNAAILANKIVTTSTADATGTPPSVGALWNKTNAAGDLIIKTWTANAAGTAWVVRALDDAVIGNLNAATINAGIINAARFNAADIRTKFLEAGKITAGDIVTGTLTSASGVFGTIDASIINAGYINAARLQATDIRTLFLTAGKITAGDIVTGTLTSASGVFGTIDASIINAGTINAARYNATDIRTKFLAAGKITAVDMVTGTITATSGVIASLDGGVITADSISGISIKSKTIEVDSLLVGAADNLVPDFDFTGKTWGGDPVLNYDSTIKWGLSTNSYVCNPGSTTTGSATIYSSTSKKIPVVEGEVFAGSMFFQQNGPMPVGAGTGTVQLRIYFYDAAGNLQENMSAGAVLMSDVVAGTWTQVGGTHVTTPANRAYMRLRFTAYFPGTGVTANSTTYRVGAMFAYRASTGNLIVNGAITGDHLDVQSVAAKVGSFVKVEVENIVVTGTAKLQDATAIQIAADTGKFISLGVDQLTAGTANMATAVADKMFSNIFATNQLMANQVIIGSGLNVIPDPGFINTAMNARRVSGSTAPALVRNAVTGDLESTTTTTGTFYFRPTGVNQSATVYKDWIPVVPGQRWRFAATMTVPTGGSGDIRITGRTKDGQATSSAWSLLKAFPVISAGTREYIYEAIVPSDAYWMLPEVRIAGVAGKWVFAANTFQLQQQADNSLIVDGGITAKKITFAGDANNPDEAGLVGNFAKIMKLDVTNLVVTGTGNLDTAVVTKLYTEVVRSRRIDTDLLNVGRGANPLVDPYFEAADMKTIRGTVAGDWGAWSTDATMGTGVSVNRYGNTLTAGTARNFYFDATTTSYDKNTYIPVEAGQKWRLVVPYKSGVSGPRAQLRFIRKDGTTGTYSSGSMIKDTAGVNNYYGPAATGSTIGIMERIVEIASDWAYAMPYVQFESTCTSAYVYGGTTFTNMATASLIVDGAIVAKHLTVTEDMWTNILHFKKLTGLEIDANSLTSDTGWIGILRGGVLINDSVDTGIIKADAITSKHTITGALIQTSATALRGVKTDSSGIKAYTSTGVNSFSLDSTTGNMIATGLMQTSPSAQRVVVWDRADGTAAVDMYADTSGQHGSLYTQPTVGGINGGYVTNVMHYTASPITTTNWTARMTLFADESWAVGQRTKGATISGDLNGAIRFQGKMVRAASSSNDTFLCGATGVTQAQTGTITVTYGTPSPTATRIVVASCNAAGVTQGATQSETASGFNYVFSTTANNNNLSLRWWTIWTT